MGQRRMFSPDIVSSEEFLTMPVSSRELYFQLGMNADDDGFVQPGLIMKLTGSTNDDLKVLLAKRFLLVFESGVVVIKHWLIHNMIRADRYKTTRFQNEKKTLIVKENRAYTEQKQLGGHSGNQMATTGCRRLGKVRLGKVSIDKEDNTILASSKAEKTEDTKEIIEIMDIFREINPTLNYGNKTNRQACQELIKRFGIFNAVKMAKYAVQVQGQDYAPMITNPYQLKEKLAQLKIYSDKTNKAKMTSI